MKPICALDWQQKQVFRGKLALALAGLRAHTCKNPRCGRARHCLAAFRDNVHDRESACSVMTQAEFDAVGVGIGRLKEFARGWYRVEDAAWEAAMKKLPKDKRVDLVAELERRERERQKTNPWIP